MTMANLTGRVCVVTGGSRGIGRGIALQLGQAGALVYVTGRSKDALKSCCDDINSRGGQGIPLVVDHSNDAEVKSLFEKVDKEQQGKLDLLVNNAYAGVNTILKQTGMPFWETDPVETWDIINNVGLRNHYLCSVYAARLMVPRKSGLIVNISSAGGMMYLFNVAYGVGKAGVDKMAHDCGQELKKKGVTMVGLWPGAVRTETITEQVLENPDAPKKSQAMFAKGESLEFSGKAVAHLAADPDVIKKAGRILLTADLAREYSFVDDNGVITGDMREIRGMLASSGWTTMAAFVPKFLRLPHILFYMAGYKF